MLTHDQLTVRIKNLSATLKAIAEQRGKKMQEIADLDAAAEKAKVQMGYLVDMIRESAMSGEFEEAHARN